VQSPYPQGLALLGLCDWLHNRTRTGSAYHLGSLSMSDNGKFQSTEISHFTCMEQKPKRGFALLSPDKLRKITRLGGIASHMYGRGHEWTSEEARIAGRKGGRSRREDFKINERQA
jgi:uncharacterized protein